MKGDFCRACGASIPPRFGEGTCVHCDPAVAALEREVAVMNRRARLLNVIETLRGLRQHFLTDSLDYDILTDCIKRLTDIRNVTDR